MIVVSDTTPIITLMKIDKLDMLQKLFDIVTIPMAVYTELTSNNMFEDERNEIISASFIEKMKVNDTKSINLLMRATGLDKGESEAIILFDEINADILLIDEVKGRKVAKQMGMSVMGTIGMLMAAYDRKIITKDDILSSIEIIKGSGRHISDTLYGQLLSKIKD